jgi:GNAT superfamily N-acetyltransferase
VQREQTICPKSARGHVRTLIQQEKLSLVRDHLLRLDPASRHERFNGFLDDDFIERYAVRCVEDGTVIIAYIENGLVRGAAELHPPDQSPDSPPEVAFSVESSVRRKGVGTILFRRLIAEARCMGYRGLRITTGAEKSRDAGARAQIRRAPDLPARRIHRNNRFSPATASRTSKALDHRVFRGGPRGCNRRRADRCSGWLQSSGYNC